MIVAYLLLGVRIAAGTVLPASLVIANWFSVRRGLAMGIANAGSTTGGMLMTLVAGYAIRHWGWRAAYLTLGTPMIVVVIPLVLMLVRSRPPGEVRLTVAQAADRLEGFEARLRLRHPLVLDDRSRAVLFRFCRDRNFDPHGLASRRARLLSWQCRTRDKSDLRFCHAG